MMMVIVVMMVMVMMVMTDVEFKLAALVSSLTGVILLMWFMELSAIETSSRAPRSNAWTLWFVVYSAGSWALLSHRGIG